MRRFPLVHDAGEHSQGAFSMSARQRSNFGRCFSHLSDLGSQQPFLPPLGLGIGLAGFGFGFAMLVLQ